MKQFTYAGRKAIKVECRTAASRLFYEAHYDEANDWIYANWTGIVKTEEVMEGASAYLELLEHVRCPHLLNDNTHLIGTWDKANEWIAEEWTPKALVLGLKNFAHIVSPSIFGELSAKNLEVRVENAGFVMRTFNEHQEAKAWLKKQQSMSHL